MQVIGNVFAWDFPTELEVKFADVRAALTTAGFDESFAREMLPRQAFAKACRKLASKHIVRLVETTKEKVRFQFTREEKQSGELIYNKEAIVSLDRKTNIVSCPESPQLATAAKNLLGELMAKRNASDLNRLVREIFDKKGEIFTLKPHSGVYFVPVSHLHLVSGAVALVSSLGGTTTQVAVPEGDTATKNTVKRVVADKMTELLAEHEAAVEAFASGEKGPRSLENAAKRVEETRLRIEGLGEYLEDRKQEILRRVEGLKRTLRHKLNLALEETSLQSA